jgi:hypothetical protein
MLLSSICYVKETCYHAGMKTSDAIKAAGTQAMLARVLRVSRQAVHQWPDEVPALQRYALIEAAGEEINATDRKLLAWIRAKAKELRAGK